jgi:hypothetical protein
LAGPPPRIELIQAGLRAILAPKPDRAVPDEIADDDAVGVAPLDRHLVEPDHAGAGRPGSSQLLAHVLLFQRFDGVPVEPQLLGHVPDRRGPTAPAHVEGEALGVEGVVRQEGERLPLHRATAWAGHAPHLEVEVDPQVAAGEIPNAAAPAVVPPALHPTAGPTRLF